MPKVQQGFQIDVDELYHLDLYCEYHERSKSWVIRQAIHEYLSNHSLGVASMSEGIRVDHELASGTLDLAPAPETTEPKWTDDRYGGTKPGPPVK